MIDSHHHFWWAGRHSYHWPDLVGDRFARDFTPDDLRLQLDVRDVSPPLARTGGGSLAGGVAAGTTVATGRASTTTFSRAPARSSIARRVTTPAPSFTSARYAPGAEQTVAGSARSCA